ncbi:ABC transporter permease [Blastococcus saxobsidens]|uniref:Ribose ABC transporter, permease protein n=1 Tax=Blastococcus saxobsidens (strain DD2) TaxID=1146883 RepID=H6RQL0_BLASD|nr:ABC transporter permease [Blastococcus saxobsidens]CCG05378.1 Ribose ABC transporter, permease protein [Blastococcus saxobsidens DD2]
MVTTESTVRLEATGSGSPDEAKGTGVGVVGRVGGVVLQRYALLVALAALIAVFSILRPESFFSTANLTSTLGIQASLALLALGVTVVLLVGEFDLSAASVMGMSASVVAYLTTARDFSVLAALGVVLVAGLLIGAVTSFFVVKVGIHSFIVTLGMGTLVTGAAIGLAGTTTIGGVPQGLTDVFRTEILGIEAAFFIMLVVALIGWILLQKMPLGRNIFFTGEAPTAAALAGIRVNALRVGSLVTSSVLASLAGVMLVGQIGAASPSIAAPYLLPAYAAAFLGATAFTPGRFNVWGTLFAVYLLAVGTTGFQLLGLSSWVTDVFNGAVLILAVAFSRIFGRKT